MKRESVIIEPPLHSQVLTGPTACTFHERVLEFAPEAKDTGRPTCCEETLLAGRKSTGFELTRFLQDACILLILSVRAPPTMLSSMVGSGPGPCFHHAI